MNDRLRDAIRLANRDFQEFIEQVAQNGQKILKSRGAARRLGKVNLRLSQVSRFLPVEPGRPAQSREAEDEILTYRQNLKTLRGVMESLRLSLSVEKARLENARVNVRAAGAWAASLRQIS